MTFRFRSAAAALASAAAVLTCAAPAPAAETGQARFHATFEATFETTWDLPEYHVISDCFHKRYSSGAGTEKWQIRSRGRTKVGIQRNRAITFFHMGTWEFFGDPDTDPMRGAGMHTRNGRYTDRTAPGDCGGEPKVTPSPEHPDCGTKLPSYEISFSGSGRKVMPLISTDPARRNEDVTFDDCPIEMSDGLVDGSWPEVEGNLPKKLIKSRKPVVITARKSWQDTKRTGRGYGAVKTRSSLSWKLTLTPAR